MENKAVIITSIVLVVIATASLIIFYLNKTDLSPTNQSILEDCKLLSYNGDKKIDIVFFSSKEQAEKYMNFFYTVSPFDKNKNEFNFYYIDDFIPECEIYRGIAILCYSQEIIKKSSSCPNDYIIVLKEEQENIRSSSYLNVISINTQHTLTVLHHEFGHAFAVLAEEYIPADIPRGSKNCQSSCNNFDVKNGCFQQCSKDSLYRSIDNGIMRTLSSNNYGIFNEKLILEKINKNQNKKLTGLAIQEIIDCSQERYYLIEANYTQNQITILDKSIQQGCHGGNGEGEFSYRLTLSDGTILTTSEFNPELIFTDSQNQQQNKIEGETYTSDKSFLLKVPIIENSKSIEIYKENEKLKEINLQNPNFRPCKI